MNDLQTLYPKQFYMIEDLKKCELLCLKSLDYELNYYTSFHYVNFFALNGYVFSDDVVVLLTPRKIETERRRSSATNSAYNSTNQNSACSQRENFSQKNIEKIYSLVKEILEYIIDGKVYLY